MRLGYCLNLHAAEDLEQALAGMQAVTLPLAARLGEGKPFGVGLYLPAALALELDTARGQSNLARLGDFLAEHQLDPFTANAFPYGGFHRSGLKRDVFRPAWSEHERLDFTLAVARGMLELARRAGDCGAPRGHLSISTHAGRFGRFATADEADRHACALGLARAALGFARLGDEAGTRVVLALEAEPRSSANDTAEVAAWIAEVRERGPEFLAAADGVALDEAEAALERCLGTCLDACHSAVELEEPEEALELATRSAFGKLQFSSALCLTDPGADDEARARFLALDEPRYLHQVTGRRGTEVLRADDLPDLVEQLGRSARGWLACEEWRCHFHVPVDLAAVGDKFGTTVEHVDRLLDALLADPTRWRSSELHVELETYTWDVLPNAARGAGELTDGLEREMRHALARLESAGWRRA